MITDKAVFIDRDGTINYDPEGYICKPEKFELFPNTPEAIKKLNQSGFKVFVVTNQSGIARGYYSEDDVSRIHQKLRITLSETDAEIDDIFISPYHKDGKIEPYNIDHKDRKPGLGMFYKARKMYDLDIKNSYMIGDKHSDIEFGKKAGLTTILVLTGKGKDEFMNNRKNWSISPDFIVKDFLVAVNLILHFGDKS